ncbi:MAG TPA: DNA ligase D [Solirubrobacteraceae bacterium]|nr:DNA ligase D [Solirubrobacteraceae bacterium]
MADRLEGYRAKRRADHTPEPRGEGAGNLPGGRARFVVQEHHARRLHWDLRLEHDGVAVSWAIPNGIPDTPKENRKAVPTEDHPLEYLDFEGDIPAGQYGAGSMRIWDHGTYETHEFSERKVEVTFHGERLQGRYGLFPAGGDWLIHRMDPPSDPGREPMPEQVAPMLARAGALPADPSGWAFEVKWDGVRAVAFCAPGRVRLQARSLADVTAQYPEVHRIDRALGHRRAVLDGEIVAFDERGLPSFERLQRRMHVASPAAVRRRAKDVPATYVAFDLLWLDGHSLTDRSYAERRAALLELGLEGPAWRTPEAWEDGAALLEASRAQGLEGIVAKRLDCPYEPGRRANGWIKVKHRPTTEVVVAGWVPGEGRRRERIGALLVGVREARPEGGAGELRYAGRVGTGFSQEELDRLATLLAPLEREQSPFAAPAGPRGKAASRGAAPPRGAVFVEPRHVAEVEYAEWTRDGILRAPSYKGLRDGNDAPSASPAAFLAAAREVRGRRPALELEVPGPPTRALRLANPDKVLYPATGFTKRDLVAYLAEIAPVLLPHLRGRELTLKRYPNGVEGQHFYEKNAPSHRPDWVHTANGFVLAQDVATLVWLGNLADLELHPSLALAVEPERPTTVVFDLDPGEPANLVECCRVGLVLRGLFEQLGLHSVAKTSGSKGLQVYVPLNSETTYAATKPFAKAVAELLEQAEPELVVSRQARDLRDGRVLVDWSQNDRHKTTVAVYSPRARERPTVSTPVTWEEVQDCLDAQDAARLSFTTDQVLERVGREGDLFAPALSLAQVLPSL